ncbi:MAG: hypothetical protein QW291_08235 [Thermofilaceae archaeon]
MDKLVYGRDERAPVKEAAEKLSSAYCIGFSEKLAAEVFTPKISSTVREAEAR